MSAVMSANTSNDETVLQSIADELHAARMQRDWAGFTGSQSRLAAHLRTVSSLSLRDRYLDLLYVRFGPDTMQGELH